jgi:hypothetical protein
VTPLFFSLAVFAVASARAESPPEPRQAPGPLESLMRVQSELTQVVCDPNTVSRAPTLVSVRGGEGQPTRYEVRVSTSEARVLSFLLEDQDSGIYAPTLSEQLVQTQRLARPGAMRKVSLEICNAVVTPGRIERYRADQPGLFFEAQPMFETKRLPTGGNLLVLTDAEKRFGRIGEKWFVAGWIEPYEVDRALLGGREYVRLAHPVTNRTQSILLRTPSGVPLGVLLPSPDAGKQSLSDLQALAEQPSARKQQVEVYRQMIEIEAYRALQVEPQRSEKIRNLQEFYRNTLGAYQVFPNDARFGSYAKRAKLNLFEGEARRLLTPDFFEMLAQTRLGDAKVTLQYFKPDDKLQSMLEEFRRRLSERP